MSNERAGARVRLAVVAVVALVTCVQLFGVTFISIPPDAAPVGTRGAAQVVLHSYFEEEWKLFAPSPVNADRNLLVQAAWDEDGEVVTGEWIDVTAIDDSVVRHSVGAPRSAYLTSRLAGNTDAAWGAAGLQVREKVAAAGTTTEPLTTDGLVEVLREAGEDESMVDYLRDVDVATTTYITDVLRTLEPDHDLVAVRFAVRVTTAPSWDQRHDAEKVVSGTAEYAWRTPAEDDPDRRAAIAGYLERNS